MAASPMPAYTTSTCCRTPILLYAFFCTHGAKNIANSVHGNDAKQGNQSCSIQQSHSNARRSQASARTQVRMLCTSRSTAAACTCV